MSRRVVRLSRLDQERLDKGEISAPEEALHNDDPKDGPRRPSGATAGADTKNPPRRADSFSAHDRDLLAELPPHFGKF